jgi:serine protease Do/serine protease DegQ
MQNQAGLPSLAPVLRDVTPAVVNIAVLTRAPVESNPLFADPFFRRFFDLPEPRQAHPKRSAGSGVIVDAREGYVLTNHHVIENADKILVKLKDRRTMEAQLVGTDPETDIALLKIPAKGLTAIPFGDSSVLEVGDFVVAIGNPFGLGQTVTSGIISALGRSGLDIEGYEDFIQTDASINPGNSGGPLLSLRGEIIGVNTAIIGPNGGNVGIGFAVPSNMAKAVMQQLVRHGGVRRGRLGVSAQDLTPQIAEALGVDVMQGAVVSQVDPRSAAEQAGLRVGDVVVAVDGRPIDDSGDLRNAVGLVPIGDTLNLTLLRSGKTESLEVKITQAVAGIAAEEKGLSLLAGSYLQDFRQGTGSGPVGGVLVAEVRQGSQAWRVGLRARDIILGVNRQRIDSVAGLRAAVEKAGRVVALTVQRDDNRLLIVIE